MENLSRAKKILIIIGACAFVFVVLNFGYFWANLKFIFHGRQNVFENPAQSALHVQAKITPNMLIINSLGITAPIVYATATNETAYQAALINGVVHYPDTAGPGQLGNCYIFGHSSDFIWSKGHYKNVFAVLPQIKQGAEIIISDPKGNEFIYAVTGSHEVSSSDLSVLGQQGYKYKLLTLQTSYPVGTALARWVVTAEIK